MEEPAINAILFGALLFVLGMIPSLSAALIRAVQNLADHFSAVRGPIYKMPAGIRISGDNWLVAVGGVAMIAGLLALLAS